MEVIGVAITVADLDAAEAFYRDVLEFPVARRGSEVRVVLGRSVLRMRAGPAFIGVHHLAFAVAPENFEDVRRFAAGRLAPVKVGGSDVIDGPPGWDSRSVYFLGPEGILLEYIAREHHRGEGRAGVSSSAPPVLALSEVGIGVRDVASAVQLTTRTLRIPAYPPQEPDFAPVGGPDGLLVFVADGRRWFPSGHAPAAQGPVEVSVRARAGKYPVQGLRLSDTPGRRGDLGAVTRTISLSACGAPVAGSPAGVVAA